MERGPLQDVVRPSVLIAIISVSDVGQPVATVANNLCVIDGHGSRPRTYL